MGGRTVVRGRLPEGAVLAIVIDDRGDEHSVSASDGPTYAVELDVMEPLVRFEDASGTLVALPLPADQAPVPDAPEPCPICAAVAWVVTETHVRCGQCGFALGQLWSAAAEYGSVGVSISIASPALEPLIVDAEQRTQPAFPVYGIVGHRPQANSPAEHARSVQVTHDVHAAPTVHSACELPPHHTDLRALLAEMLETDEFYDDRSEAGQMIGLAHDAREARRRALRAPEQEREFRVNGVPVPFKFLAADRLWLASADTKARSSRSSPMSRIHLNG